MVVLPECFPAEKTNNQYKTTHMKALKYVISRGRLTDQVEPLQLDPSYLQTYKNSIAKQLSTFIKQIIEDDAEIELTVAPDGKQIIHWKVAKWTSEGYDQLITSNVI